MQHESRDPVQRLWIRADGTLPDDPLLHACVATYASDMSLFDTMLAPHEVRWDDAEFMGASLDHCMWFHRPFRADDGSSTTWTAPTPTAPGAWPAGFLFTRDGDAGGVDGPGGPDAPGPPTRALTTSAGRRRSALAIGT